MRTVRARDAQLVPPGAVRSVRTTATATGFLVITADPTQPVGAHRAWLKNRLEVLTSSELSDFWPRLSAAIDTADASSDELEQTLLGLLQNVEHLRTPHTRAAWVPDALAALERAPGRSGTSRSVSNTLGFHPVHLARVVRDAIGVSVRELVRRRRVSRAEAMLRSCELTISEIAHRTGFADHAHLCREFSRRMGMSPSEFRRRVTIGNVALIQDEQFPAVNIGQVTHGDASGGPPAHI